MRQLRLALRTLFKTPFVSSVAILSLALGIGANAAIFSLFNQFLLQALPVEQPGRLVNFESKGPKQGSTSTNNAGNSDAVFTYLMFRDLEREQQSFTAIAGHRIFGANLGYAGQTENASGLLVSGQYFAMLGLRPALGRLLAPGDDGVVGEGSVVVLNYDYWTRRFDQRESVLNEQMTVNGQTMTIVGVAPRGFFGTTLGEKPTVFVPITMRARLEPTFSGFEARNNYWVYLFARLKPGISREAAQTAINGPYRNIIQNLELPLQTGLNEDNRRQFAAKTIDLLDGTRGQSSLHAQAAPYLVMLLAVTGVVLLIACANIANLLLARASARSGEMALRLSLGASRGQLIRQLLLESCLLAILGGAAGLLVAQWTMGFIMSLVPQAGANNVVTLGIDLPVLAFSALISIGTGVLFGLFPALQSTRPNLASTLKGIAGQPGGGRPAKFFRNVLVTLQIALSMGLLASAGLFLKSLVNVTRVDLGVDVSHLVMFQIAPRLAGYPPARTRAIFEQTEVELAAIPGAKSVTAATIAMLRNSNSSMNMTVQGFEPPPGATGQATQASYSEIGPGYFRALGVALLAGREFTPADTIDAPKVAIVNEAFLRKFNLGRDAVGHRIERGSSTPPKLDIEIVGIIPDIKYSNVKSDIPAVFYTPYRQNTNLGGITFYVRSDRDPQQILPAIRETMKRIDPILPVVNLQTMPDQIRQNVFQDHFFSTLAIAFAALATILASVGLYGVLAYTVSQRTREFGLRMALGANPGRVRGIVMRQMAWMIGFGAPIGLGLATVVRILADNDHLLFQMQGQTVPVFAAATVVLAIIALLAAFYPALRASRIDPMRALRYE